MTTTRTTITQQQEAGLFLSVASSTCSGIDIHHNHTMAQEVGKNTNGTREDSRSTITTATATTAAATTNSKHGEDNPSYYDDDNNNSITNNNKYLLHYNKNYTNTNTNTNTTRSSNSTTPSFPSNTINNMNSYTNNSNHESATRKYHDNNNNNKRPSLKATINEDEIKSKHIVPPTTTTKIRVYNYGATTTTTTTNNQNEADFRYENLRDSTSSLTPLRTRATKKRKTNYRNNISTKFDDDDSDSSSSKTSNNHNDGNQDYFKRKRSSNKCETSWHNRLLELTDFKDEFKHTNVPQHYTKNKPLGF